MNASFMWEKRRTSSGKKPAPPLDAEALRALALRYVERFATTRARLGAYLERKLRERGWDASEPPEVEALVERIASAGYIDDAAFADARARSFTRRGLGARRLREQLRYDGVAEPDRVGALDIGEADRIEALLAFARRKRIGPWAREAATDPALLNRQVAGLLRAGHAPGAAWKIARMAPGTSEEVARQLLDE